MSLYDSFTKRPMFFEGAMGTMLQSHGLSHGDNPDVWNFTHSDIITSVHREYAAAGCEIFKINTFGANRFKLEGTGYTVAQCVQKAAENARKATNTGLIALDIGPLGKLIEPVGELSFDDAYDAFREIILAGKNVADIVMLETFTDIYEIKAAMLAAKENCSMPLFVSAAFGEDGRLLSGTDVDTFAAVAEGLGADAVGFNCGVGPGQLIPLVKRLREVCSLPILCNPNAGLPKSDGEHTCYDLTPQQFAQDIRTLFTLGATAVGGCCGTTPAHLSEAVRLCRTVELLPPVKHSRTVISSASKSVLPGEMPLLIGERINPTGKPKLKKALREGEASYILEMATEQERCGAHILDINVGLPDINEAELLDSTVRAVQSVTRLPLQIDSTNAAALDKALRHYNGKPLVNSVNGEKKSLETILPLVKKYGGAVVGLTLDENGIPATAEGRLAIAEKIVKAAADYGIEKKDILIDPLTITVSTDIRAAQVTLDAVSLIKEKLGVCTVLGVSNVSFGLPQRDKINAAFFTMALERGLDAGIVNPGSEAMMSAYISYCTLAGYDESCQSYIDRFGVAAANPVEAPPKDNTAGKSTGTVQSLGSDTDDAIKKAVAKGLCDAAYSAAKHLLKDGTKNPVELIDTQIVPALDEVGEGFGKGKLFLPQLLMSARAASGAFDAIREHLARCGTQQQGRGKVVIATVKGDVHDIGKNITVALLENYGFEVIDLGKDVPAQLIAQAVRESGAKVCGLSALMTTTVPAMKQTVELLNKEIPSCKTAVGGAVLTPEYAAMIGADFYARDAMCTVRYCREIYGV